MALSQPNPASVPRIPIIGWAVLLMLVMASVLFFIDRQTLAILKSTISTEFALNNQDYGLLLTAYMLPYTIGYLFSGQLIDRWGTRGCATLFLIGMSAATVACGLARNFNELMMARVALGIAESGVVPSIMVLITKWYPQERRGFVVTMHQALQSIGPVITAPLVAAITLSHGWRTSFVAPGLAGFALALIWFLSDRAPMPSPVVTGRAKRGGGFAALRFVVTSRLLRGVLLARVVTDPCWFFLIYWQAAFLQERGGWTLAELGHWTWLPPAVAAIGNVVVGLWSDRMLRKSADAPTARRVALQRLVWLAPCLALAPFMIGNKAAVLTLLVLAYFMANCWLTMINVLVTELAPPGTIATTLGTMSALGGATSIIFNYAAGPLVDRFGYDAMFIICAFLHPIGAFILYYFYRLRPAGSAVPP